MDLLLSSFVWRWLVTFALTCFVELLVATPMMRLPRAERPRRLPLATRVKWIVTVNLLTHPLAFVLAWRYPNPVVIVGLELVVATIEAALYARSLRLDGARAAATSFMANAASVVASLALWTLVRYA